MKKETIHAYVQRRLKDLEGQHARIAAECGIAQASISRIYLGKASPTLETVQPLLDWLEKNDRRAGGRKMRKPIARSGVRRAAAPVG